MSENIHKLLPDRDIDSSVDVDAIRDSVIQEEEQSEIRKNLNRRIAQINRSRKAINNAPEQKAELIKAFANKTSDTETVVVKQGEIGLTGATSTQMANLLSKLNINLNVKLTKNDTMNLLATLLTCNEAQLNALQKNSKVPIVIKAVITRLLKDAKAGEMDTIERIWDRVFGKSNMVIEPPSGSTTTGIIPNVPVSRETYVVIREAFLGAE